MNTDPKQRFILMIAMGLTFLLLMQYMFPPAPAPAPARTSTVAPAEPPTSSAVAGSGSAASSSVAVDSFNPGTDYTVKVRMGGEGKNEHGYEATFSTVGGGLVNYRLLGYYRVPGDETDSNRVVLLDRMARGRESLRIDSLTYGPSRQELRTLAMREARFELIEVPAGAVIEPAPDAGVTRGENLVFRAVIGDWELLRTYRFSNGVGTDFTMKFDLSWRNISDGSRIIAYRLAGPAGLMPDDDSPNFGVINFLTARQAAPNDPAVEIERKALRELVDATNMSDSDNRANLAWIGAKNRFFVAIMTASSSALVDSNGAARSLFAGDRAYIPTSKDMIETLKSQPTITAERGTVPAFEDVLLTVEPGSVAQGGTYQASYTLYAGPAVDAMMESADPRLHGVVSYTISYLDFISRWLVLLLTWLDGILGNYGLAIIAVTIIIKLLLHPLNRKSFVSMNKMTKLAPMMKEIQKKFGSDKAKMQVEMSKFYKDHGVSMAGGCLPVFLQLPIFFALYGAFSQGFSMRHAAFIPGWIQDLSKPDSVYDLGWTIPLLSSSHISLLPILYLGLQYLQMSLQPKPTDPQAAQQQKIMKFMPLMFVFIFYAMPAGLVLYFTVSALAGVAESWWMRKRLLPKLGLGDTPKAAEIAAASAQAGAGAAVVPSDARKKKRRK